MHLIDTHCHLDFSPFIDDIEASLFNAKTAGITNIVVPAVTADRFSAIIRLANKHEMIWPALGLHPIYIKQHTLADIEHLYKLLREQQVNNLQNNSQTNQNPFSQHSAKIIAIGEIGLDNFIDSPDLDKQIQFLEAQISLANQFNLPVLLHSRRTHDLLLKKLKQHPVYKAGVIHGFSGSYEQAMEFVKLGYKIGVGGTITYPRATKTRTAITRLPLESLVLETDAPDMPVLGRQGLPNRPEYLVEILKELIEIRNEPADIITSQIHKNTHYLFYGEQL